MGFKLKKDKKKNKKEKTGDDIFSRAARKSLGRKGKKDKKKKKKKGHHEEEQSDIEAEDRLSQIEETVDSSVAVGQLEENQQEEVEETEQQTEQEGVERVLGRDSIELHREEFEDSIENHRNEFEDGQIIKLHDWYEAESAAMDDESLKRKPWYQKTLSEAERTDVDEEEDVKSLVLPKPDLKKKLKLKETRRKEAHSRSHKKGGATAKKVAQKEEPENEGKPSSNETSEHEEETLDEEPTQEVGTLESTLEEDQYEEESDNEPSPIRHVRGESNDNGNGQEAENGHVGPVSRAATAPLEDRTGKKGTRRIIPISDVAAGCRLKDDQGREYELVPVGGGGVATNTTTKTLLNAINEKRQEPTIFQHPVAPIGYRITESEDVEEFDVVEHNGNAIGFRTRQVIEDEVERLDYARKSLARLERIEELRKSRERMKIELEQKKQRRKERYEQIRQSKRVAREARRTTSPQKKRSSSRKHQQKNYKDERDISVLTGDSEPMALMDLVDVIDRKTASTSRRRHDIGGSKEPRKPIDAPSSHAKWGIGTKEIPVIVDLTDRRHPQQILDLTRMEDPPSVAWPQKNSPQPTSHHWSPNKEEEEDSPPRRRASRNTTSQCDHRPIESPPRTRTSSRHHTTTAGGGGGGGGGGRDPPTSANQRIKELRREREEKLRFMNKKMQKVKAKDVIDRAMADREKEPSAYKKMMERVTRNVDQPFVM